MLVLGIAVLYGSVAIAETNSTALVAISIDGDGGEMNAGSQEQIMTEQVALGADHGGAS